MKCAKCGEGLLPEAVACPNCGQPVRSAFTPAPPRPSMQKPHVPKPSIPKPQMPHAKVPHAKVPRLQKPRSRGNASIPNYLLPSLLSLCCCMPFGIIAIIHGAQVNTKLTMNDPAGAAAASRKARFWCIAAYVTGILTQTIWYLVNGKIWFFGN